MWERACSRWRQHSQPHYKLTHRHREQARSHRGSAVYPKIPTLHKSIVGASLLAMASAQPASLQTDTPLSRASSLPQRLGGVAENPDPSQIPVGASLLAKASAQPTSLQTDTPLSRASSLPQGLGGVAENPDPPQLHVGASLLAMASAQPTSLQTDTPLSRAGSLPQGFGCVPKNPDPPQIHCGSELARDGGGAFSHIARSSPRREDFRTKHLTTGSDLHDTAESHDNQGLNGGYIKNALRFTAGSFRYV